VPVDQIELDLVSNSSDPDFPFGPEPSAGYPLAFRGALDAYFGYFTRRGS